MKNKLSELLIKYGYTTQQVADGVGVNRSTVSRWANNVIQPSADKLGELCKFFDISLNDFYDM